MRDSNHGNQSFFHFWLGLVLLIAWVLVTWTCFRMCSINTPQNFRQICYVVTVNVNNINNLNRPFLLSQLQMSELCTHYVSKKTNKITDVDE